MARKRDFHQLKQPEVIIIPMIDIMLFLLVFFMVSTMYMVQLNTLPVSLPAASSPQQETKPTVVSVTVNRKGNIFYDMETKPSIEISDKAKATLAEKPDAVFVVRGDRETSYQDITRVLDALKGAGAKHVSLAAEAKGKMAPLPQEE